MNVHAPALAKAHRLDEQTSAFAARRDRRPVAASEAAVAEIFLRRHRLGTVRADHAAAGILPDPHRARHPARSRQRRSRPSSRKARRWSNSAPARPPKSGCCWTNCDFGAYVPVDISGDFLKAQADALRQDFPGLAVYPVAADFTAPFALPDAIAGMPKVGFFPGSTLGNFEPHEACAFLRSARDILGTGAQMIIGVDLEKDERVLYDAYNDAAGVTARFNLNVLVRINRELGGNFDLSAFTHRAIYNRERHRIEMHLISKKPQTRAAARHQFLIPRRRKHPYREQLQIQPRALHGAGARLGLDAARILDRRGRHVLGSRAGGFGLSSSADAGASATSIPRPRRRSGSPSSGSTASAATDRRRTRRARRARRCRRHARAAGSREWCA